MWNEVCDKILNFKNFKSVISVAISNLLDTYLFIYLQTVMFLYVL